MACLELGHMAWKEEHEKALEESKNYEELDFSDKEEAEYKPSKLKRL